MLFRLLCVCFYLGALRATATLAHRQEVDEANLRDLLTVAEWSSLLGTSAEAPEFAVVWPQLPRKRRKRWALPDERSAMPVVFEAQSLGRRFELQLRPSPALLDPQFVLLSRWSNRTDMLSPHLAEQSCFYRSDGGHRAAVALCGGMVMKPCDLSGDQAYQRLGRNPAFIVTVGGGGNLLFMKVGAHLLGYTIP